MQLGDPIGRQHISPRRLDLCCGFAKLAQDGDPLGAGLRVWFTDDGQMVCHRCMRAAIDWADEELKAQRRRERRRG